MIAPHPIQNSPYPGLVLVLYGLLGMGYYAWRLRVLKREQLAMEVRHAEERRQLAHRIALYKHMLSLGQHMPWLLKDPNENQRQDGDSDG